MDKSLNMTSQTSHSEDENIRLKYQLLNDELEKIKKENQTIQNIYKNDQDLFKNRKSLLYIAQKTIQELRKKNKQLEKSEQEHKKKCQKIVAASNAQKNKEITTLTADLQNQKKGMSQCAIQLYVKLQDSTQKIKLLGAKNYQLGMRLQEHQNLIKDQAQKEKDVFQHMPQQSIIKPTRERVLLRISEADLINQNKSLVFQIENLKKKMKEQQQISAKKQNGLMKSIQNYQTIKARQDMHSSNQPQATKNTLKNYSSCLVNLQNFNIDDDEEIDTCDVPSLPITSKDFFITLQRYCQTLQQNEGLQFLHALSSYTEKKLDQWHDMMPIKELGQ